MYTCIYIYFILMVIFHSITCLYHLFLKQILKQIHIYFLLKDIQIYSHFHQYKSYPSDHYFLQVVFLSFLSPSFFPSLLPFQYAKRSLRMVKQKEGRYLDLFSKDCIQYLSLSTCKIFCFFSLSTQRWSYFNYFQTDEYEDVAHVLLLFVAFSLLRLHIHVSQSLALPLNESGYYFYWILVSVNVLYPFICELFVISY